MQVPYASRPPSTFTASWPRLVDLTTSEVSPSTTTSTRGIKQPSTPVVFPSSGYHYKKKTASNLTITDGTRLTDPSGGNLTPKDTMSSATTTAKTHKSNFSLSSFIGGAPIDTKRRDPSLRSTSGASGTSDRNQGSLSQEHSPSGIQNQSVQTLEPPPDKLVRIRKSSSTMSLKLKIPRLKQLKLQKSKDLEGQYAALQNSDSLPLSANAMYRLGRMAFQRNGSVDSMSPRGSKDAISSATSLPSPPATSMMSRNEEEQQSVPATPRTIPDRSSASNSRPSPNMEDKSGLPHDAVPNNSGYRNSQNSQALPTRTQDDLSLNTHSAIGKYKSWRLGRRASLSATTNLLSFSEFRPLSTRETNTSSLKLHQGSEDDIEFHTRVQPGYSEERPMPSSSPTPKYPTEQDLYRIPSSLIHTDMTFSPSNETPLHPSQPPVSKSTTSTTPTSRAPSSSSSRVSTPELTSISSHYTTSSVSSNPPQKKLNTPTPAQMARWREDVEMIMTALDDEFYGEVCLMRYEPRQGWFGFWNKGCMTDVISELRELRSPRT